MQNNSKSIKEIVIIAGKLLIICAIVAALVASVNLLTKDTIALNQKKDTAIALTGINESEGLFFSVDNDGNYVVKDADGNVAGSCETADIPLEDDIDAVYIVKNTDGEVVCYCVEASPMGFKNEISMIVAVNPDKTVKDVRIIALSDTKGIGDKVTDAGYLKLFQGVSRGFSENEEALREKGMIIAGATRTSEPVSKAVDVAVTQVSKVINSNDGGDMNE